MLLVLGSTQVLNMLAMSAFSFYLQHLFRRSAQRYVSSCFTPTISVLDKRVPSVYALQ